MKQEKDNSQEKRSMKECDTHKTNKSLDNSSDTKNKSLSEDIKVCNRCKEYPQVTEYVKHHIQRLEKDIEQLVAFYDKGAIKDVNDLFIKHFGELSYGK